MYLFEMGLPLWPFGRQFQAGKDGLKSVDITSKYSHKQVHINNDQIIPNK